MTINLDRNRNAIKNNCRNFRRRPPLAIIFRNIRHQIEIKSSRFVAFFSFRSEGAFLFDFVIGLRKGYDPTVCRLSCYLLCYFVTRFPANEPNLHADF